MLKIKILFQKYLNISLDSIKTRDCINKLLRRRDREKQRMEQKIPHFYK